MNFNLVVILVSIVIIARVAESVDSPISNQVQQFTSVCFGNAPLKGACQQFYDQINAVNDAPEPATVGAALSQDCQTYSLTKACYQEFKNTNGEPAESDLSSADRQAIEQACANAK